MDTIRAGKFFLKQRGTKGTWQICWYEGRQTRTVSCGTSDVQVATELLFKHALRNERAPSTTDAQLAHVLMSYYENYGQALPSAGQARIAFREANEFWPDADVSKLTRPEQLRFIAQQRAAGYADWTIQNQLGRVWAALNWARRDNPQLIVPDMVTAADWKPILEHRDRVYTPEELGLLLSVAAAHEHWWRFTVLAIGTAGREAAIRELTWAQIDTRVGRIALNPPGRRQTSKRRAIVPIAPTLASELDSWGVQPIGPVVSRDGQPVLSREFFDAMLSKTGLDGGPHTIRHTVRTWLAEQDVPDAQADMFMGHLGAGSRTGAKYIHRRPEYLSAVKDSVESLYVAVAPYVTSERRLLVPGDARVNRVASLQKSLDESAAYA